MGIETVAIFSEADRGAELSRTGRRGLLRRPAQGGRQLSARSIASSAPPRSATCRRSIPATASSRKTPISTKSAALATSTSSAPRREAMSRLGDKNEARQLAREAERARRARQRGLIRQRSGSGAAGPRDRLSGADQGVGRRRRPRDARGRQRSGAEDARSSKPRPRPRPRSATPASIWKNTSSIRGTSKCKSWPIITATSCIFGNAIARCSGGIKS